MTDYESKLKINHLSNIIKFTNEINHISPILTNIYKEEYYQKIQENNKKIISLRCKNKKCYKIFIDPNDYEVVNIEKENKRKRHANKFTMKVKCNKCNYISKVKLE